MAAATADTYPQIPDIQSMSCATATTQAFCDTYGSQCNWNNASQYCGSGNIVYDNDQLLELYHSDDTRAVKEISHPGRYDWTDNINLLKCRDADFAPNICNNLRSFGCNYVTATSECVAGQVTNNMLLGNAFPVNPISD
jgi:hypothetical protein